MCTVGEAECDAEFFEDCDSWFEHELSKHRSQYTCILCKKGTFSFGTLKPHILETHGTLSDAQLKMLQEAGREVTAQFKAQDCPFCDEWAETLLSKKNPSKKATFSTQDILVSHDQFKSHVSTHQEQLAIFALQRANGEKPPEPASAATSIVQMASAPSLKEDRNLSHNVAKEIESTISIPPLNIGDSPVQTSTKSLPIAAKNTVQGGAQKVRERARANKSIKPETPIRPSRPIPSHPILKERDYNAVKTWTCVSTAKCLQFRMDINLIIVPMRDGWAFIGNNGSML